MTVESATLVTSEVPWLRRAGIRALAVPSAIGVIYALCAFWTRSAADVPAPAFAFEQRIPLVAWTVIPYLSLYLLLVVVFFCCPDRHSLQRLSLALLLATLLCAVGFIVSPMRLAYEETYGAGLLQGIVGWFHRYDNSFNRFPSLHVSLAPLLWPQFARVRYLGAAAHPWFLLILASTLLTHQHHVIDVGAGLLVAAIAAFLAQRLCPNVISGAAI